MEIGGHSLHTVGLVCMAVYQVWLQWSGRQHIKDDGARDERLNALGRDFLELKAEFKDRIEHSDEVIDKIYSKISAMNTKLEVLAALSEDKRK